MNGAMFVRSALRRLLPLLAVLGLALAPVTAPAAAAGMHASATMPAHHGPGLDMADMDMEGLSMDAMPCCPHETPDGPDCAKACALMALCWAKVAAGLPSGAGLPLRLAVAQGTAWRLDASFASSRRRPRPSRPDPEPDAGVSAGRCRARPRAAFHRVQEISTVTKNVFARASSAALLALAAIATTRPASAEVKDYAFQLVQQEAKVGEAVLAVRLVDTRTGRPVPDAVIFAKRLDMAPDSMEEMVSRIEQMPATEPGVYRFKAKLSMAGGWRLSLGAKVQGETGTVESKLVFKAVK